MKSLLVGVTMIGLGAGMVHAQAPPTSTPFVAVGCVARAVHDGSLAGSPGVPPSTPNSAPVLANSSEPTGAFLLNNAVMPRGASGANQKAEADEPRSYALDGERQQFEAHVGHRIEVTGRLIRASAGARAGEKTPVDHIQVTSLKMLATTCPPQSAGK